MEKKSSPPSRRRHGRTRPTTLAAHARRPLRSPSVQAESVPLIVEGYDELLDELKSRIRAAQLKAARSVNRELMELYWQIGRSIVERQRVSSWGKAIVERLSRDIQSAFPGISGFSPQNVWKMRALYVAWTEEIGNLSHPVREIDGKTLPQAVREIPWGHNVELLFKLKDPLQRLWYARQSVIHGWSRSVLMHQIENNAISRSGKAITNFHATLPPATSDLASQLLKDPYNFEFLTLDQDAKERDLEKGLIAHLKDFLIELGVGFAFVGQQYALEVAREDFYLDLLFYHLALRRYIVIDLKVEPFKPEFAGKMNFYLSAIDDQLRRGDDQPSIGLVLCKTRNAVIAEYALRDTSKPMGVATYTVSLPEALRGSLPSPEEIARELNAVELPPPPVIKKPARNAKTPSRKNRTEV